MNDEVNCTRLAGTVGRALLCKQCICSHKYQKQIFGVTAENLLLVFVGTKKHIPGSPEISRFFRVCVANVLQFNP